MLPKLPRKTLIELCRRMLLIRHFEEALIGLYRQGSFKGHYHVYIGQEATGVPALACVEAGDYLFTTHRNHGHLLARGAEAGRLLAEILGRRDGYNKGKGGSFHTNVTALGFLQTSGVVAGILPLAIGAAYALKSRGSDRIGVCLFGDGALEEGAVAESFNISSLWRLPVLFLCENNGKYGAGRAVGAGQSSSMAAYPLTNLPATYGITAKRVDGTNSGAVHRAVSEAIQRIRRGGGPQFIEAQTVRWPGGEDNWPTVPVPTEVGMAWDASSVPEAARAWYRKSDPLLIFIRDLVKANKATRSEIARIDREVRGKVEKAVKFALASPYPEAESALEDVFA
ncbi:MAG: thiamine pyrophosphate-dependent dehydrogenase E1 component subunit alpha [Candidatus Binatia bacterium]|nr:thiamine pyrophosphate-dependent dehydrogenase E1 component subunit alpha [Candidatus Binatia bacterium]